MSVILDELIKARREGAVAYEKMLEKYIEQVNNVMHPEDNPRYPQSIRHSAAMRAFFDNCGEDEALAIAIDRAVRRSKQADFRHNIFKIRGIKAALFEVLGNEDEVERVFTIVVEQEEY